MKNKPPMTETSTKDERMMIKMMASKWFLSSVLLSCFICGGWSRGQSTSSRNISFEIISFRLPARSFKNILNFDTKSRLQFIKLVKGFYQPGYVLSLDMGQLGCPSHQSSVRTHRLKHFDLSIFFLFHLCFHFCPRQIVNDNSNFKVQIKSLEFKTPSK